MAELPTDVLGLALRPLVRHLDEARGQGLLVFESDLNTPSWSITHIELKRPNKSNPSFTESRLLSRVIRLKDSLAKPDWPCSLDL